MRTALCLVTLLLAIPTAAQPVEKAGFGPARTLSDVARERNAGVQGVVGGTFSVTGASGMPALLGPVYGEGGSFEEVDRTDAAHRPAPAGMTYLFDPYLPNYFPYGYGGTRTHYWTSHTSPPPAPSAAPAPRAPAPARHAAAPRHTTSGRTR